MFIAPKWLAPVNGTVYVTQTNEPSHFDIGISKINNLNGYIPKIINYLHIHIVILMFPITQDNL